MKRTIQRKKPILAGFTLLELLVVVAIIGFLSAVAIVALSVSQAHQRDTQRLLDQATILKAVELYVSDNGTVPAQLHASLEPQKKTFAGNTKLQTFVSAFIVRSAQAAKNPDINLSEPPAPDLNANTNGSQAQSGGSPGPGQCSCAGNHCGLFEVQAEGVEGGPTCVCSPSVPCSGGGGPSCGNGQCQTSSGESNLTCLADCHCGAAPQGNGQCDASLGETFANCPADCQCGNGICQLNETYSSCPSDCSAGGGSAPTQCGNSVCNSGETPGNCSQDCPNYGQCFVNGQWNLCCLFGGTYCAPGGTQQGAGYYGVCNGSLCEQRYLLNPPATPSCTTNAECAPPATGGDIASLMIADSAQNYLVDLQPYLSVVPKNPGGSLSGKCGNYYVSSHPDIVKNHLFCIWQCFETRGQIWPYADILYTPEGNHEGDTKWSVACSY